MPRPALALLICAGACAVLIEALGTPARAEAHALFGDQDPDRPLGSYLGLGFGHMVGGWDHLLFIAGVVLLAGSWRTAAKLISLFVLGHSLTLLVATLAGWELNATLVDVVIALSLVYVAAQGLQGKPTNIRMVGALVFAFGLVHGLGLSTRLQDLGLPDSGLVERILLFNVGVELGQLTALTIIVGLGLLFVRFVEPGPEVRRLAFAVLGAVGLIAALILLGTSGGEGGDSEEAPAVLEESAASCTVERSVQEPSFAGGHPSKSFYRPEEEAPAEDLDHVVGDGYVIVYYDPTLEPAEIEELQQWVRAEQSGYVIGAPAPELASDASLTAVTAEQQLSCSQVAIDELTQFRDAWFERLQTGG